MVSHLGNIIKTVKYIGKCKGYLTTILKWKGDSQRGIYLALVTDPEGDSCFSIYKKIR